MISFTSKKKTWDEIVQKITLDISNHSILQVTPLVTKMQNGNMREKKNVKVVELLITITPVFHNKCIFIELLMTVQPCHRKFS